MQRRRTRSAALQLQTDEKDNYRGLHPTTPSNAELRRNCSNSSLLTWKFGGKKATTFLRVRIRNSGSGISQLSYGPAGLSSDTRRLSLLSVQSDTLTSPPMLTSWFAAAADRRAAAVVVPSVDLVVPSSSRSVDYTSGLA